MDALPPLHRVAQQTDAGSWISLRRRPVRRLAPFVVELQGYHESAGPPVLRKETPKPVVPMILVFGPGFDLHDNDDPSRVRALDRSFVAGLHHRYALVGSRGAALCLQVNLTPLGAHCLLGGGLAEMVGQVVDLDAALGAFAADWECQLADLDDWPARFALVEDLLWHRVATAPDSHRLAVAAWQALAASGGAMRIDRLAAELGCSRKHLSVSFHRAFGMTPKAFARVQRFDRAVQALGAGAPCALADLAQACGYADQAHFSREIRAFAGETPTDLMAQSQPHGNGLIVELT